MGRTGPREREISQRITRDSLRKIYFRICMYIVERKTVLWFALYDIMRGHETKNFKYFIESITRHSHV